MTHNILRKNTIKAPVKFACWDKCTIFSIYNPLHNKLQCGLKSNSQIETWNVSEQEPWTSISNKRRIDVTVLCSKIQKQVWDKQTSSWQCSTESWHDNRLGETVSCIWHLWKLIFFILTKTCISYFNGGMCGEGQNLTTNTLDSYLPKIILTHLKMILWRKWSNYCEERTFDLC